MKLLKLGVFLSMLLMTPVLEAQNTSVSLWEENIEQLSMDEEEKNWEDELEELSDRLHEPVNINVTTKHELEQFSFFRIFKLKISWLMCIYTGRCKLFMNCNWWKKWISIPLTCYSLLFVCILLRKRKVFPG